MTYRDEEIKIGLSNLPQLDAVPSRIERIRSRCRASLEKSRPQKVRYAQVRRWLEPAIAFGVCALYLAVALGNSLTLFR
jgi:hypothetical protein